MINLPHRPSSTGGKFPHASEILGIGIWMLGVVLLIYAFRNDGGLVPSTLLYLLRMLLGVGAYLMAAALIVYGLILVTRWDGGSTPALLRSFVLCLTSFLTAYHLQLPRGMEFDRLLLEERGGLVGAVFAAGLRKAVGDTGSYVILAGVGIMGLLMLSDEPMFDTIRRLMYGAAEQIAVGWSRLKTIRIRLPRRRRTAVTTVTEPPGGGQTIPADPVKAIVSPPAVVVLPEPETKRSTPSTKARQRRQQGQLGLFTKNRDLPAHFAAIVQSLDPSLSTDTKSVAANDEAGVRLVEDTLASFRIEAKVTNIKRGPVITRYEVQPAPGIRISRITNLADDLALALAAIDVRVEAPVPGKSVIGIEVPNKRVALVRLREIIELDEFARAPSKLNVALGKDIAGTPRIADLAAMPHLLISGATNSGKSVCLNAIITSILARAEPEEVKLSLIDPKRVELTPYKGIPHLYHPVVVDARDAVRALRGAIREMDLRYRLFNSRGVRNIQSYNDRLEEGEAPLYYIVIIIDELADLMMQAAAEFERLICRLAQMARATGIHLVLATQRPSVNVITGVIKANISSRIAFAVASQVDSRTILDMNGAERLIGSGDMLFHPIDAPKPVRIQGAYVSEDEVSRVVDILKDLKGGPEYALDLDSIDDREETPGRGKDSDRDELFDEAVALVRRRGIASASMLQREFEIGYPRAGRLVDQLEAAGIIGPQDGSKPREVMIGRIDAEEDVMTPRTSAE